MIEYILIHGVGITASTILACLQMGLIAVAMIEYIVTVLACEAMFK